MLVLERHALALIPALQATLGPPSAAQVGGVFTREVIMTTPAGDERRVPEVPLGDLASLPFNDDIFATLHPRPTPQVYRQTETS